MYNNYINNDYNVNMNQNLMMNDGNDLNKNYNVNMNENVNQNMNNMGYYPQNMNNSPMNNNSMNNNSMNNSAMNMYNINNYGNNNDLIINGGNKLDPSLVVYNEMEIKVNEAIANQSTLSASANEFVPLFLSGNNQVSVPIPQMQIFKPIKRNYKRILTIKEINYLINGYARMYIPFWYNNTIQSILKLYYFPNEDIGLIKGTQGYISYGPTYMYCDTKLSQKLKTIARHNTLFKVMDIIPFYKESSMNIFIQVKILKLIEHGCGLFYDKQYITDGGIVLIKWEHTSIFEPFKREIYQKMIVELNPNGYDLKECKVGELNQFGKVYDNIGNMVEYKSYTTYKYFGRHQPLKFRVLYPDFDDITQLYTEEILYCYFESVNECGYVRVKGTNFMDKIIELNMNKMGINTDIHLFRNKLQINVEVTKQVVVPMIGYGDVNARIPCHYIKDDILESTVVLSLKFYINEFGNKMIPVQCRKDNHKYYGFCYWIDASFISKSLYEHIMTNKKNHRNVINKINSESKNISYIKTGIINAKYGIITKESDAFDVYRRNNVSSVIGTFYENNKFILMNNKIKIHYNNPYIKVKLYQHQCYHNECYIDFRLKNKSCYVLLTSTNLG